MKLSFVLPVEIALWALLSNMDFHYQHAASLCAGELASLYPYKYEVAAKLKIPLIVE